jgi:hypothetical protein
LLQAFKNAARHGQISTAELAGPCCGFVSPADRPVLPCSSAVGCQASLQASVAKQLGFVGLLFAGGAGGCLLLMALTHAYIERINFDRQKAASGSAQGMSIYSGQDASRDAGAPGVKNATRTLLARQGSVARGALPPADVRTGFGAAAAYDDDPDPAAGVLDEQPLMGVSRAAAGGGPTSQRRR